MTNNTGKNIWNMYGRKGFIALIHEKPISTNEKSLKQLIRENKGGI